MFHAQQSMNSSHRIGRHRCFCCCSCCCGCVHWVNTFTRRDEKVCAWQSSKTRCTKATTKRNVLVMRCRYCIRNFKMHSLFVNRATYCKYRSLTTVIKWRVKCIHVRCRLRHHRYSLSVCLRCTRFPFLHMERFMLIT